MSYTSKFSFLFWAFPLLLFFLYIPFSLNIDLFLCHFFSTQGRFNAPQWTWFVYTYGLLPGQILFIGSSITCLTLFILKSRTVYFFSALYLSLVLIIGGGLVSHALLKQFWQRPRPKQTILFGGKYPYCDILTRYKGEKDRNLRSLPSGHATMGFYFFSFIFLGMRFKKRLLSLLGITISLFLGGILTYARLAQGGHFLSDIILTILIMWQSAYWLDRWIFNERQCNS